MAEFRFSLLFCAFSVFMISSAFSRSLQEFPKTTILDVPSLFRKSNDILSFDPKLLEKQLQQEEDLSNRNNSSFSLKLYPRELLRKTPFKNYRDLTIARHKSDTARLNFMYKKLKIATERDNTSDISQMDVEVPVSSGLPDIGGYFARFGIGTPAKQFNTIIDTGSVVTWINCASFDPSASSTYKPLTCDSQLCNELRRKGCISSSCQYEVTYGDNSSTKGDFATETFTLGSSIVNGIPFGCGRNNEGTTDRAPGILGLGGGPLSFPSQLNTSSFSYCLVDGFSSSSSTLGFGSTIPSDAITIPIIRDNRLPIFYFVALTGIRIGQTVFTITGGGRGNIIVDSGTTITQFPAAVYNTLRDEFVKGTKNLPLAGSFDPYDTCFNLSSGAGTTAEVPTITFQFGTKSLNLPQENYLRPVDTNIICFAFRASNVIPILGNIQQQGIRVSFDLQKSLVGFSPGSC